MDIEDVQSMQFMQWSTPQFCAALLERLLPAMKTSDETLIMHGLELLQQVAVLLHESVIADALWDDGSVPARELVSSFVTFLFRDLEWRVVVSQDDTSMFIVICR